MATKAVDHADPAVSTSLAFLENIFADCRDLAFAVRLWEGTTWSSQKAEARFTLALQHRGALRKMFTEASELSLGEAYVYNDFDVEGDFRGIFELGERLLRQQLPLSRRVHLGALLRKLPDDGRPQASRAPKLRGAVHSKERDSRAVRYHYDVSNEFYSLWLDRRMVYSAAYFVTPEEDLDRAQERKLDYLCRKLRLRPGERLLDVGCGWGGLMLYAAQHYGVRARGITLSEKQAELARQRIRDAGLEERCQVEICDYRDLDEPAEYDKLVSVGMFEHVGAALLPEYFRRAFRLLKPGGVFLNTGIAALVVRPPGYVSFSHKYVFPDGELVPIATTLAAAQDAGFEVRDVESLREHYALTLERWVERLEAHAEEARRATDDVTYRIWRLYMAGSAHRFRRARLSTFQALFSKTDNGEAALPLTRADWYEGRY